MNSLPFYQLTYLFQQFSHTRYLKNSLRSNPLKRMVLITFLAVSLRSFPTNRLSLLRLSSCVTHIWCCTYAIWKDSDIIPIPKSQPPTCEDVTRPISLTSCMSKVLEDFVVRWMISDIESKVDPKQFGCLKGFNYVLPVGHDPHLVV